MESCEICNWTGNNRGYYQHVHSEKHTFKCEISRLKRQVKEQQSLIETLQNQLVFSQQILKTHSYTPPPLPLIPKIEVNDEPSIMSNNSDKDTIIDFLEHLCYENYESICEEKKSDSLELKKWKHVFGSDYEVYGECTWGVRFETEPKFSITYARLAPILSHHIDATITDEMLKYKWYTTKATRVQFEKNIKNNNSYFQILDLFETIDEHNWEELTKINSSDDKKVTYIKKLLREDFDQYGYTTIIPNVFPNHVIKYTRSKGCGKDEDSTFF